MRSRLPSHSLSQPSSSVAVASRDAIAERVANAAILLAFVGQYLSIDLDHRLGEMVRGAAKALGVDYSVLRESVLREKVAARVSQPGSSVLLDPTAERIANAALLLACMAQFQPTDKDFDHRLGEIVSGITEAIERDHPVLKEEVAVRSANPVIPAIVVHRPDSALSSTSASCHMSSSQTLFSPALKSNNLLQVPKTRMHHSTSFLY